MCNLPDSMYDYRPDNNELFKSEEREVIGECHVCGEDIYDNDDYRYRNDALMHDECLDEYEEDDEDIE